MVADEKIKTVKARLQERIDALEKRLRIDSNDIEYESHLRQKRELTKFLTRLQRKGNS